MTTRLLILLAAALLCWAASAQGQTIKSLGYNSTNGNIVAATNVTFTNSVGFATNARSATRTNLGLGATWLTNTNVTNFRTAVGLGTTNDVTFNNITISDQTLTLSHGSEDNVIVRNESGNLELESPVTIIAFSPISFNNTTNAAATRTNLGLGLPALTNTSNVTAMRALAGSTNTNQPFSGSISVVGTNNTNTLVFSNGILLSQ